MFGQLRMKEFLVKMSFLVLFKINFPIRNYNRVITNDLFSIYFNRTKDGTARYGNAHRRAVLRTACYSLDSVPVISLTLQETDPTQTCPRRKKGQASCSSLGCDQCHLVSLNLVCLSNDAAVGAIAHGFAKKTKQHDRHFNLSRCHGIVEHHDVDWDEMELTPTGKFDNYFKTFSKSLEKVLA